MGDSVSGLGCCGGSASESCSDEINDNSSFVARVLVIEDGAVSAKAICLQLTQLGYIVAGVFASGEEALSRVCELAPDVVVMDIGLAGKLDGVDTAEQIHRLYDVPVVYLTSATDDATFQRAKLTNPLAWLEKPVSLETLHRGLRMALYQRELYRKLRISEAKYRRIVETMSEGLVILDAEYRIIFANSRFQSQIQCDSEGCFNFFFPSMLSADTAEYLLDQIAHLDDSGKIVVDGYLRSAGGGELPVRFSVASWGGTGEICHCEIADRHGYICVVNDMSAQRASELARREAENRYRTLFESVLDGVYQSLPDGRFLEVNPAMAAMFGYDSPSAMIMEVGDISTQLYADPADRALFLDVLRENGRVSRHQVRMKKRNGEVIWVELSAHAVCNEDDEILSVEGMLFDITERKLTEQDLRRRASRDDLTGLYNRVYFREWFDNALVLATRNTNRLGLLYVDLNDFKKVNDMFGHMAGDKVLREVAVRLRDCVRESDMVARIGGDEFCVALEGLHSSEDAMRVAMEINQTLSRPLKLNDTEVSVGASLGVAIFPDDGMVAEDLLGRADTAMYKAKQDGAGVMFWRALGKRVAS
ncbi:diguanylate cyclase domain-containing protein [Desulfovibrio subterraneus]|uniref:diguanylate cyclase domain-containing protein n=1 Tax=Desulfovibrio subterraneus TaxID=2718620 RepID=UPI0023EAA6D3|nr:diguanylate cyclase [Desulfovibrio subterraneus]